MASRVFMKYIAKAVACLTLQGCCIYPYQGNWLFVALPCEFLQSYLSLAISTLESLGFVKSRLKPSQFIKMIGACLDSVSHRACHPVQKAQMIHTLIA